MRKQIRESSDAFLMRRPSGEKVIVIAAAVGVGAVAALVTAGASLLGWFPGLVVAVAFVGSIAGAAAAAAWATRAQVVRQRRQSQKADRKLSRQVRKSRSDLARHLKVVRRRSARRADVDDVRIRLGEEAHSLRRHLEQVMFWNYRQAEALANLHAIVDVRAALPMSREFTASPDILLEYVSQILGLRPSLIVECGSGLSTIWAGYAAELCGPPTRVIALEDDDGYLDQTRKLVEAHGLTHVVEVRHAPITSVEVMGGKRSWYDTAALDGISEIGVLFVDGPVGFLAPYARYPAVPILRDRFAKGAVVLVDDADRPEERDLVGRWQEEWPELVVDRLRHEKGTLRVRVPG